MGKLVGTLVFGAVIIVALSGCASNQPAPTKTVTVSATPRALQAGDMDTSVPAVCGQISAVETIAFNAREAHQRGELSDEGYQSRLEAARYVYAHLPTNNAIAAAVIKLQSWLSDHPTTAGALALDPDDSGLQDAIGAVTKSCSDAGSPIGVSAAYGG